MLNNCVLMSVPKIRIFFFYGISRSLLLPWPDYKNSHCLKHFEVAKNLESEGWSQLKMRFLDCLISAISNGICPIYVKKSLIIQHLNSVVNWETIFISRRTKIKTSINWTFISSVISYMKSRKEKYNCWNVDWIKFLIIFFSFFSFKYS